MNGNRDKITFARDAAERCYELAVTSLRDIDGNTTLAQRYLAAKIHTKANAAAEALTALEVALRERP